MSRPMAWVLGLGLLACGGCFEDSPPQTTGSTGPCSPGEQRSCGCPGDPEGGVQVCEEDGSGFGSCACGDTGSTTARGTTTDETGEVITSDATGSSDAGDRGDTTSGEDATTDEPPADTGEPPGDPIILYATEPSTGDFLAGEMFKRPAADARCEAIPLPLGGCNVFHAVLGIDAADTIEGFAGNFGPPAGVPVLSTMELQVAASWSELVAGNLDSSLVLAQVTGIPPWTGSNADGTLGADCAGWTNGTADVIGDVGNVIVTDSTWMSDPGDDPCNQARTMLCACWME